jgi:hypothetical protein
MSRQTVEWDNIENRFIDNEGNLYTTIDTSNHHLTTPSKLKVKTPSNPRDFFLLDVFPFKLNKKRNPDTLEKGYALVKPYNHNANLRIGYEIKKWDTRQTYNDKLRKEINRVLNTI